MKKEKIKKKRGLNS